MTRGAQIQAFEPWFFILFGIFHLHRIWALVNRRAYADFWLGVMQEKGVIYYGLMGLLSLLCIAGIVSFFCHIHENPWWRWIYLLGGGYVLFDLFAIATGLSFWQRLLQMMFDTTASYWTPLWSLFIVLGAFSLGLGIWLLKKRYAENGG